MEQLRTIHKGKKSIWLIGGLTVAIMFLLFLSVSQAQAQTNTITLTGNQVENAICNGRRLDVARISTTQLRLT